MSVTTGNQAQLLLDGYNVHQFAKSFQVMTARDILDASVLGTTSREKLAGLKHASASGEFFIDDTTTTGSFDVLKSRYSSTPALVAFAPAGFGVGSRVLLVDAVEASLTAKAVVDDLELLTLNLEASEDATDFGVSLSTFAAVTSLPSTGTAVDNAVATTNGGVAMAHVTAIAGGSPNVVITVEHSTDNSTWVTLVTFTAFTAAGAQRVEVAAGTTVRRYLRRVITEGGTTTSVTSSVEFARR